MRVFLLIIGGLMLMSNATFCGEQNDKYVYLSDNLSMLEFASQGWGILGVDCAAHEANMEALPMKIKDKSYSKGIGTHSPAVMYIDLDGQYKMFEAEVGVQVQQNNGGSVVFKVFVDDKEVFNSGIMKQTDEAKPVKIALDKAVDMRLEVSDAGDGIICDVANWAEARLLRRADAAIQPVEAFPVGRFASVLSWDPERMDGARNSRAQEFNADELFLESEVPDEGGVYTVPLDKNGVGCIGLQWLERRRLAKVGIEFAESSAVPDSSNIQIQYWSGISRWQGSWKPLPGEFNKDGSGFSYEINWQGNLDAHSGTMKIRWIFPREAGTVKIRELTAYTKSRWLTADIYLQAEKPEPGTTGSIEIYNGEIADNGNHTKLEWDLEKPLNLKIRYSKPRPWMSDKTVLRVKLPNGAFGVAINDIVKNECVYAPDFGFFAAVDPVKTSLAQYKRRIANKKTILEKVRKMPDQTFEQAMAKLHRPEADFGPTMLSLANHNRKYHVSRDGSIEFTLSLEDFGERTTDRSRFRPVFTSNPKTKTSRNMTDGWLPIVNANTDDNGVIYTQRTFVAPYDKTPQPEGTPVWANSKPLCVAEIGIRNTRTKPADIDIKLHFASSTRSNEPASLKSEGNKIVVLRGNIPVACVDLSDTHSLQAQISDGTVSIVGKLGSKSHTSCNVYIPGWEVSEAEIQAIKGDDELAADTKQYWRKIMEPAMQISIPDPTLQNIITASQMHCMLAARNDNNTDVQAWASSFYYGPLESEGHSPVRGMQFIGHADFARRSLDFFEKLINPSGYITTGYTVMGTGWHLWTLGEFYQLYRDKEWLKSHEQDIVRVCKWIMTQRQKTKKLNIKGDKVPEYGLMPPGVLADWELYAYYMYMNGYYCAGLKSAGEALADIGCPDAEGILADAGEYKNDIMRAFHYAQSLAPLFLLQDGTWVPEYPTQVFAPAPIGDFYATDDVGRSWCYDIELGAHHLIPQGVMDPQSNDAKWMMNHMEDVHFLHEGWFYYPADRNHRDWFNFGGFAKVQPYYARTVEVYALQDDVKAFVRSYFNTVVTLLNREDMSLWEHFFNGAYNKTHETGYFLHQTANMLVIARGNALWLAPFVTSNWMKDGMVTEVRNAPTKFGQAGYKIISHVNKGYIEAFVTPPVRETPSEIVIRLRHPDGKKIRSVKVDGRAYKNFDPNGDTVTIKPDTTTVYIQAYY